MMSKEDQEHWNVSTNFTWDLMRTDSGTEDNIYRVLFIWILDKYGKHLHVTNMLNTTSIQNPSTQKCSSLHFLTIGYF